MADLCHPAWAVMNAQEPVAMSCPVLVPNRVAVAACPRTGFPAGSLLAFAHALVPSWRWGAGPGVSFDSFSQTAAAQSVKPRAAGNVPRSAKRAKPVDSAARTSTVLAAQPLEDGCKIYVMILRWPVDDGKAFALNARPGRASSVIMADFLNRRAIRAGRFVWET
jgi:hypothetical protein